jgi:DMSO/TMAO reductase YedYZ heme-binding membrane subunit
VANALKSWPLFWALALVTTAANGLELSRTDLRSEHGAEAIIVHSVLRALPLLLLAFTASSLLRLWPSRGTRWLMSNRRYVGVAFAFGMAWHFLFVGVFISSFGNPVHGIDLALDCLGLVVLLAMTITSFRPFKRRLSSANWRRLHKAGIYTLWLLPTVFYSEDFIRDHDLFSLAMVSALLAALALRGLAWARQSGALRTAT